MQLCCHIVIYTAARVATCEARQTRCRRLVSGTRYLVMTSLGGCDQLDVRIRWREKDSNTAVVMLELQCRSWTVVVIVGRPPVWDNAVFTTSNICYEPVREDSWPRLTRWQKSTWSDTHLTRKTCKTLFHRRTRCRRHMNDASVVSSRPLTTSTCRPRITTTCRLIECVNSDETIHLT